MTKQALITDTNYKCLHCGKSYGDHQAKTFNCPRQGRGNVKGYNPVHVYAPNRDKPDTEVV